MVKFLAENGGRKLLGLGVTEENLTRLVSGQPIHIFGEEIGIGKMDIMLFFGKDETAMRDMLKEFVTPETKVNETIGQ